MDERLLNKQEVCDKLRCSLPTLDRMIRRGELPVVRVGRRVLLRELTINEWIRTHEHGSAKEDANDGTL